MVVASRRRLNSSSSSSSGSCDSDEDAKRYVAEQDVPAGKGNDSNTADQAAYSTAEVHGIHWMTDSSAEEDEDIDDDDDGNGATQESAVEVDASLPSDVQQRMSRQSLRCAFCGPRMRLDPAEIAAHIKSKSHLAAVNAHYGLHEEEMCPVTINGIKMLLDNHVIFPDTMFGPGAIVWDDDIHMGIAVDACGGVRLRPHRRYRILMMAIQKETTTLHASQFAPFVKRTMSRYSLASNYRDPTPQAAQLLRRAEYSTAKRMQKNRKRRRSEDVQSSSSDSDSSDGTTSVATSRSRKSAGSKGVPPPKALRRRDARKVRSASEAPTENVETSTTASQSTKASRKRAPRAKKAPNPNPKRSRSKSKKDDYSTGDDTDGAASTAAPSSVGTSATSGGGGRRRRTLSVPADDCDYGGEDF